MVDVAQVKIYDIPMGIFRLDNRYDNVQFEYDNDFVSKGLEPSPLMMPTLAGRIYSFADLGRETFKGLPGLLADSLPDTYGRALFDRWLSLTGRTSSNIIETLCFLGKRCMGALEFEPAIDVDYNLNAKVEIDSLVDVAREALQNKESFGVNINEDKKAAIAEILRLGTSAGGHPFLDDGWKLPSFDQIGRKINGSFDGHDCCRAQAPYGFTAAPMTAVMETESGYAVNLYENLTAENVLHIEGNYPLNGKVRIVLDLYAG